MTTFRIILIKLILINALFSTNSSKEIQDILKLKEDEYFETIRMKNARPKEADDLQCTYLMVNSTKRLHITGYIPHATKKTAHHMVLFGCKKPAYLMSDKNLEPNWYCGSDSVGICEKTNEYYSDNIIYAWALNAKGFDLPDESGFRIGGDTDFQYLVLQMHYKKKFDSDDQSDNSGVTLKLTEKEIKYQVGYYIIGNNGYIPPKLPEFHMESGCKFDYPFDIIPFRYRTHAHNLGRVISAYVIKPNGNWFEIGRQSPQQPQLFYFTTMQNVIIKNGDAIVSRCTMNSISRKQPTFMGQKNSDEMCNFYVMYKTNYTGNINNIYCFRDAQKFSWSKVLSGTKIPENASNLKGVTLMEPENEVHHENE